MAETKAVKIAFWKMHGAGNDFVMFDDRNGSFPATDADWLRRMAARRTGIGCEGVILIQASDRADFRMRFFNPDGHEAEMCGNGARCAARLASEIGAAGRQMTIETAAGILRAGIEPGGVRVTLTPPADWRLDRTLALAGKTLAYGFVNSGVPHVVVEVEDLDTCDVQGLGSAVRHHADFRPEGANANFVRVTGPSALAVRTYERGVEAESGACGTGIVAAALICARAGRVRPPVRVQTAGGDVLTVDFHWESGNAKDVTLLGPAEHVFQGVVDR